MELESMPSATHTYVGQHSTLSSIRAKSLQDQHFSRSWLPRLLEFSVDLPFMDGVGGRCFLRTHIPCGYICASRKEHLWPWQ